MYYRYELVKKDTGICTGLFRGLSETGISEEEQVWLTDHFDSVLPIPDFFEMGNHNISGTCSYFKETGMIIFRKSLEQIQEAVNENGTWEARLHTVQNPPGKILYQDWYQIICQTSETS